MASCFPNSRPGILKLAPHVADYGQKCQFVLIKLQEGFFVAVKIAVWAGFAMSFPVIAFQLWRFVAPGLRPEERRNSRGAVFFVGFLFLLGLLFGYYVAAPMSINFLSSYQVDESIVNQIDIQSYVSTLTTMTLSCAFVFELPIVVFFLAKAGLVSAALMRQYRRHAIVVILIVAAVITPPDISAQIIVTIPILLLYEASIWIARAVGKQEKATSNA